MIACPHYRPTAGSPRCLDYEAEGSCARPDTVVCVEWLRANRRDPSRRDPPRPTQPCLFDVVEPRPARSKAPPGRRRRLDAPQELPAASAIAPTERVPLPEPDPWAAFVEKHARGEVINRAIRPTPITDGDVASFRALRTAVGIPVAGQDPVWLVPEYTDRARIELRADHFATLVRVLSVFDQEAGVPEVRRC